MKTALVLGGGGFIGSHMMEALKRDGYWVRGVDLKVPEFKPNSVKEIDDFIIGDLRNKEICDRVLDRPFDEVYQFAADMGGAGFVFTGDNDADIMHNSALININVAKRAYQVGIGRLLYSSSACIYPEYNQMDPNDPKCSEESAYPAAPDSEYGWEKLFSEHLYLSFLRNYKLPVRIVRYHNIFGNHGTWRGGREKAPAAFCRKIAKASDGGVIEMWGDGKQTRSFLYIDECIEGTRKLVASDFVGPVNIGSEEMVTINQLAEMIMEIAGKKLTIQHISGPLGVRGRNSDNRLCKKTLDWEPAKTLREGLESTYQWIQLQVMKGA